MTFAATAVGVGAAASVGAAGISASSGKKAAEAAAGGQLEGLGQANQTIRDAIAQYGPYRQAGAQGMRQMQRFYGMQPAGGDPNAPRRLTAQEKRRAQKLNNRVASGGKLSPREQQELNSIQGLRQQRQSYREDFDLARTVGQDEERGLLDLERNFGQVEEGIYGQQKAAQEAYTARNAQLDENFRTLSGNMDRDFSQNVGYLDKKYENDTGALDRGYAGTIAGLDEGFNQGTGWLDKQYYEEEAGLRDKISKGDVTLDPGYKFRLEQGQLARERGAAAKGGLLSGGHLKDLEDYSQGLASQEFGAATGRLYDLYGLGKENYNQRRGDFTDDYTRKRGFAAGDYERGRGYTTGDYTMARGYKTGDYERGRGYLTDDYTRNRGFGREDYGDLQAYNQNNLTNRRGTFERQYGQGMDQRNFAIDRFGRRTGGAAAMSSQGFDALNQQSGLSRSLADLYTQAGAARGQRDAAGPAALGQFGSEAANDLGFLALLYGSGGFGGRTPGATTRYTTPGAASHLWGRR